MALKTKIALLAGAGVVALAGAEVFASTLNVAAPNVVGGGSVNVSASCIAAATVSPTESVWIESAQKFEYSAVTLTGDFTNCLGLHATLNVSADFGGGDVFLSTSTPHLITAGDVTAGSFVLPLDVPIDAGLDTAIH